jgi:hypothetical protein
MRRAITFCLGWRQNVSRLPYDIPIHATAEQGEVNLDGPDGLATSLTPRAAKQSARDIQKAAEAAEHDAAAAVPRDSSSPKTGG